MENKENQKDIQNIIEQEDAENIQKDNCQEDKNDNEISEKESVSGQNEVKHKMSSKRKKMLAIFFSVLLAIVVIAIIVYAVKGIEGLKNAGEFISSQLLGMQWLNSLIGILMGLIFGDNFMNTRWGEAIQFFVYDSIKIFVLLCLLIFVISYIQSYFPPERTKKLLGKYKGLGANIMGALLGTVTPFCSCSSIPIFMGFTRAGLSSGVTFSFLISSPLVDLGAFILLASTFGFPIAIIYVVVGLILAVIGGTIIDKTGMGKNVRDFIMQGTVADIEGIELSKKDRLIYAKDQMLATLKKVWIYVLIGVGIGALIHNFIPQNWIEAILGQDKWYSVLVASLVGVPMYADIFGTIPVAEALFAKGVGVGTIISFMMSVTALSLPSLIMLSKAVKPKLLASFIIIIVVGIIVIGYIFNSLNFLFV